MIANIFARESSKLPGKHYYTMSVVAEDGSFESAGFVKPIKAAKKVLEEADAAGIMTEGVSDAGAYKMLTVVLNDDDIVTLGGKTYLVGISGLC